jgi:hypothetical protein
MSHRGDGIMAVRAELKDSTHLAASLHTPQCVTLVVILSVSVLLGAAVVTAA